MTCRCCGKEKKLVRAHVISEAFFVSCVMVIHIADLASSDNDQAECGQNLPTDVAISFTSGTIRPRRTISCSSATKQRSKLCIEYF